MATARATFSLLACIVCLVPLANSACSANGVGAPCVLELEDDPHFTGSALEQVFYESKSYQCQTRLCLSNHFRGRASCPYGQDEYGGGISSGPCKLPLGGSVIGLQGTERGARVEPQCVDRRADVAVYCSCRCKNLFGRTDDGGRYCTCPEGFECSKLDPPLGAADEGLTGSFCIKAGTSRVACSSVCDKRDPSAQCEDDREAGKNEGARSK